MKILVVTQYFWPERFRINDLCLGLSERGHEVTVVTGLPNYPGGKLFEGYGVLNRRVEKFEGMRVLRAPLVPRGSGGGVRLALNYASFALSASLLAPFQRRAEYDVIFVFEPSPITVGIPAIFFKRATGTPIMFWVQDLWPEVLSGLGTVRAPWAIRQVERLVRFIYRNCDMVLVQSRSFGRSVAARMESPDRIRYFPNSAEVLYRPVELEQEAPEHRLLPSGFCVLFAGNIGAAQGFGTLLEAAERLRDRTDIHWVVLGEGRLKPWVESEIRRRGLRNVHLLGSYPAEAMPRFFAAADALLVMLGKEPIFAYTIPSKVQSYLACARPIVGALDGEGAQVIEDAGAGVTCPAADAQGLADAVLSMASLPPAEREAMGQRGRAYFETHFERELLLDRLEGWMAELATTAAAHGATADGDRGERRTFHGEGPVRA